MKKNRIKGITVRRHLNTSTVSKAKGGCRWSLCVSLRGEKKYYPIEPAIYMAPQFWVAQQDPATGKVIREKAIVHAKGNTNSRQIERLVSEKEAAMQELVESMLGNGQLDHTSLWAKWTCESSGTVIDWAKKYMEKRVENWRGGRKGNSYHLGLCAIRHLERFDAKATVEAVNTDWLARLHIWLLARPANIHKESRSGLSISYARTVMGLVGSSLNMALEAGAIQANPMDNYRRSRTRPSFAGEASPAITLTEAEVDRLQAAWENLELDTPKLQKKHHILQQALICLYTGFRFSDLAQLADPQKYTLNATHLSLVMAKNLKPIKVAVTSRLSSVLTPGKGNGLLLEKVGRCNKQSAKLRAMLATLGINSKMDWHDLRKTFVTILYERTGDLKAVSSAVGHSKIAMTEAHYLKGNSNHVDVVVGALDGIGPKRINAGLTEVLNQVAAMVAANPGLKLPPKLTNLITEHCSMEPSGAQYMKVV